MDKYLFKIVMKNVAVYFLSFLMVISFIFSAKANSPDVLRWEKVKIKKGFVLSDSLEYHRFCSKVWEKQIPSFIKRNPQIIDIDKIEVGDIVELQLCEGGEATPVVVKKEEPAPTVEATEEVVEETVEETVAEEEAPKKKAQYEDLMIFAGVGFLSELYQDETYTAPSFTYRVKNGIYPRLGYKMKFDLTPNVFFANNTIEWKTDPNKSHQYYLSAGLGHRLGLTARPLRKVSDEFNTYALLGVGMVAKYREDLIFDMEFGTTVNSSPGLNASIVVMKKITTTTYLGGFFDFRSTDPKITMQDPDRKVITGGIIVGF